MNNKSTIALMHAATDELYHYGVLGMHWGVRRYQPYPKGYSGDGKFVGKDDAGAKEFTKHAVKTSKKEQRITSLVFKTPASEKRKLRDAQEKFAKSGIGEAIFRDKGTRKTAKAYLDAEDKLSGFIRDSKKNAGSTTTMAPFSF